MRNLAILAASVALAFPSIAEAKTPECYLLNMLRGDCSYQGDRSSPSRESRSEKPSKPEPSRPAPEKPSKPEPSKPSKPEGPGKGPEKPDPCACGYPDNGGGKGGKEGKGKA